MTSVLHPPRPQATYAGRPGWRVRLLLSLTTNPLRERLVNSPAVNAYLDRQRNAGWTLREAYFRNWVMWRESRAASLRILVLPAEAGFAAPDDFAIFVAVEALRHCEDRWPDLEASDFHALLPAFSGMRADQYLRRYARAEQQILGWRR